MAHAAIKDDGSTGKTEGASAEDCVRGCSTQQLLANVKKVITDGSADKAADMSTSSALAASSSPALVQRSPTAAPSSGNISLDGTVIYGGKEVCGRCGYTGHGAFKCRVQWSRFEGSQFRSAIYKEPARDSPSFSPSSSGGHGGKSRQASAKARSAAAGAGALVVPTHAAAPSAAAAASSAAASGSIEELNTRMIAMESFIRGAAAGSSVKFYTQCFKNSAFWPVTNAPALAAAATTCGQLRVIIDSGASRHMSPEELSFGSLSPSTMTIRTASQHVLRDVKTGTCTLSALTDSGATANLSLPDTLFHMDLDAVLLSLSELLRQGYDVTLSLEGGHIVTPDGLILPLRVENGTWILPSVPNDAGLVSLELPLAGYDASLGTTLPSSDTDSVDTNLQSTVSQEALDTALRFHRQYGHCGERKMLRLRKKMPACAERPSNSAIRLLHCPDCAVMAARRPNSGSANPPMGTPRNYANGEFLHIDSTGKFMAGVKTVDGSTHAFLLTDDASCRREAHPASDKAADTLIQIVDRYQARHQIALKRIRVNGDLYSEEFEAYCNAPSRRILLEASPPYEASSNRRAEATVDLAKTKGRVFKSTSGASYFLWPFILRWACLSWDFIPSEADPLGAQRSPAEIWPRTGHDGLRHDLPFGCRMYLYEGKRPNRDAATSRRARPGVFVGWSMTSPAYLLFDLDTQKIYEGSYARFEEDVFPLKDIALAGETLPSDFVMDADSWRGVADMHPDEVSDSDFARFVCNKGVVFQPPKYYWPDDNGIWLHRCASVAPKRNNDFGVIANVEVVRCLDDPGRPKPDLGPGRHLLVSPGPSGPLARRPCLREELKCWLPGATKMSQYVFHSMSLVTPLKHPAAASSSEPSVADFEHQSKTAKPPVAASKPKTPPTRRSPRSSPPQSSSAFEADFQAYGSKLNFEPRTRREAMQHPSAPLWRQAELKELSGLQQRGCYARVLRSSIPKGAQVLRCMWVYSDKDSGPKARLVVLGNTESEDSKSSVETYASTPPSAAVRLLLSLAAQSGDYVEVCDVAQAFIQAHDLPEGYDLYVIPPVGVDEDPLYCWKLIKPLYGLAASPRMWADTLRSWLLSTGWTPVAFEDTLYHFASGTTRLLLCFHVDDILFSSNDQAAREEFKRKLLSRFDAKALGPVSTFLGVDVARNHAKGTISLSQTALIQGLLARHGMSDCNPTKTPLSPGCKLVAADRPDHPDPILCRQYRDICGSLSYLALWTRPDLAFTAQALACHMSNPGPIHMAQALHALRYLRGTSLLSLTYSRQKPCLANLLLGFADSDWASDPDTRRSVGAYVFILNGAAISWSAKRQMSVAVSTSEAEYMSASRAANEAVWLRRLLAGAGAEQSLPTPIWEDNRGARLMSENPVNRERTKHIDIHVHNVRQRVAEKIVRLFDCPTTDMTADVHTKALPSPAHRRHTDVMFGLGDITAPSLETYARALPALVEASLARPSHLSCCVPASVCLALQRG